MHNRIDDCFARLFSERRKGFIPYICAGDPTLKRTVDVAFALEKSGADLLELGLPFSDPLADGIVNQLAAQRSLAAGTTVAGVFDFVREIRRRSQIPIVLYSYLNPIFQFGAEKFHQEAAIAGIDGLLILDLPPEEDLLELDCLKQSSPGSRVTEQDVIHIRLIAPTTPADRMKEIAKSAKGFLYYVSREGVTGARDSIATSLPEKIAELRKISYFVVALQIGNSNPSQARNPAQLDDPVAGGSGTVALH